MADEMINSYVALDLETTPKAGGGRMITERIRNLDGSGWMETMTVLQSAISSIVTAICFQIHTRRMDTM